MLRNSLSGMRRILWPLLLALAALLFYILTLAPTVLWGDDAYFQRTAFTGELRPDGGGHWLWLQIARLFVQLPVGDVAYRINLLSAVAAACTIFVLYGAAREAGLRRDGATVAVISLAVGHTFWMHAVRAEVYTLFTLFVALHLWLWARWRPGQESAGNDLLHGARPLYLGAALSGITLLAHQMALFLALGWALLVLAHSASLHRKQLAKAAVLFSLGLAPFFAVIYGQIVAVEQVSWLEALRLYFTHAGSDFGPSFLNFAVATLPGDIAKWLAFTILQFGGPAIILVAWGIYDRLGGRLSPFWFALFAFYGIDALFSMSYGVNDRYVFLLPGYVALALFCGAGWQSARNEMSTRRVWMARKSARRLAMVVCIFVLAATPVTAYYLAPRVMVALDINPMEIRRLPGRDPNHFFLWPGKGNYVGAREYGERTLAALPRGATLIADHTPFETLRYLQEVDGMRQDVLLIDIEPEDDLSELLEPLPDDAAIFLADSNPAYYNLRSIPEASLAARGPLYRLDLPAQ
ncbi:MAG: protein O-mannosyl-transferase family [Chloroflexota bacterium]